jgi:hypothetical protein
MDMIKNAFASAVIIAISACALTPTNALAHGRGHNIGLKTQPPIVQQVSTMGKYAEPRDFFRKHERNRIVTNAAKTEAQLIAQLKQDAATNNGIAAQHVLVQLQTFIKQTQNEIAQLGKMRGTAEQIAELQKVVNMALQDGAAISGMPLHIV